MTLISSAQQKVHLISLGCARNRVDSEVMLGSLMEAGWTLTQNPESADAVVVNTCGFIGPAKQESIDTILDAAELKNRNPKMKLVVTGCLTQRYKSQLARGLPEVDLFIGTDEFPNIPKLLQDQSVKGQVHAKRSNYLYSENIPRINSMNKATAYVKVAEGCQHNCAFCIIPAIRGPLRSRPVKSVVEEVKNLVADGVVEINLIAQDLAAYGRDLEATVDDDSHLLKLLKALAAIEGLQWIRPLYIYPENINDRLIEFIAKEDKIVKYLDIPVQHASDDILRSMKRQITSDAMRQTFLKLREKIPGLAIRTTVMTGFPGETEADFQKLADFVEEMAFDHLGCFPYSPEEGTVAGRMENQIEDNLKQERADHIMKLQQGISEKRLQKFIGRKIPVLVEGVSEESEFLLQGRMSCQAPEADGVVYINDGKASIGTIQQVEITDAHHYDLVGKALS